MEILHISAECYPMAKAGGLADVVGALPKYQQLLGHIAKVVMPMHRTPFLYDNEWEVVHKGTFAMGNTNLEFTIIKEVDNKLGFDLYCVDINGLLDREKIYSYEDDTERFVAFQIAVLEWLSKWEHKPDIIHAHDHHTGFIPFMMQHCYAYQYLANIRTVFTIHNAQYQGWMGWEKAVYLPSWDTWRWGLLEWDKVLNPLACAIKCADKVTTVSEGYLKELSGEANGLESLFNSEAKKCSGILNGIDYLVWNPKTDTYILDNYSVEDVDAGKALNKKNLCKQFSFNEKLPLFVFIGRLVPEKAADLLPAAIAKLTEEKLKFNFLILGSGSKEIERELTDMNKPFTAFYNSVIQYNEKLSHQMYASADFLVMPSRVEPCGLNQMYAMRYGSLPIVRRTGGLADTVIDFEEPGGYGICFDKATVEDVIISMKRAIQLYEQKQKFQSLRKKVMGLKNSWEKSAQTYIDLYLSIL